MAPIFHISLEAVVFEADFQYKFHKNDEFFKKIFKKFFHFFELEIIIGLFLAFFRKNMSLLFGFIALYIDARISLFSTRVKHL